nr:sn-glycerol-3-phosphate transporter [Halopseudomonas bauzanensis]
MHRPLKLARELAAPVESEEGWYIQGSVWTTHFDPQPDHNNNQDLIGLERHRGDSYLWGAATFRHSFGERSWYGYAGKRFEFAGTPFNAKLTAGLLYGYRGEYRDKIPFNRFGVAPAVIPSVGVSYQRVGVDVVLLGAAAAMINVGVRL